MGGGRHWKSPKRSQSTKRRDPLPSHDEPQLSEEDRQAIRELFLEKKESYVRRDLYRLLQVTQSGLRQIIGHGRLAPMDDTDSRRFAWSDVADCALHERWTPRLVHDALGDDAPLVLPPSHQFASITIRLPHYQILALETMARIESRRASLPVLTDDVLERIIALHQDLSDDPELSAAFPGLTALLHWPLTEGME